MTGCAAAFLFAAAAFGAEEGVSEGTSRSAHCKIQPIRVAETSAMFTGGLVVEPVSDQPSGFRRGVEGDWLVLDEVDATNPVVPCLLLGAERPLRIDIAITVAGKPFRSIREEWIDSAFAAARRDGEPELEESPTEPALQSAEEVSPEGSPEPQATEAAVAAQAGEQVDSPPAPFHSAPPTTWLARYFRAAGEPFDRAEARWLLAQRAGGPALLELQGFATPRSFQAPLLCRLDRDDNGELSADELAGFSDLFVACDENEDDLLTIEELQSADSGEARYASRRVAPRLFVLDDTCDTDRLLDSLKTRPDGSDGISLTGPQCLQEWSARRADLVVDVRFNADSADPAVEGTVSPEGIRLNATEDSLVASFDSTWVEFSAGEVAEQADRRVSQASLGVTVEGFPLWNLLDANQDGSLSRRERDGAEAAFRSLDRDHDRTLTAKETPTWVRVAVCWGPEVTQLLESQRRSPVSQEPSQTATAPAWFLSMDANGDGDLSRDEFLGGSAQFSAMDANQDGLISPDEATTP